MYETIRRLRASLSHYRYQVNLTIATGRALSGVRPLLETLALNKEMPIIVYNGSVIVRNESFAVISRRTIPHESLIAVLHATSRYCVRTLAYVYDDPAFNYYGSIGQNGSNEYVLGWASIEPIKYEFNKIPVQWQDKYTGAENVAPCAILIDTSQDPEAETLLSAELTRIKNVSVIQNKQHYIELRPQGSNKGAALECLVSFLGLAREEVLAFGDDDNDAEMLSWAGIGVAISGASPLAQAHSDYVCRHRIEAGAVEVLRLVRNARRYYYSPINKAIPGGEQ